MSPPTINVVGTTQWGSLNVNLIELPLSSINMLLFNVEIPNPKSMLNKGDENDPVRAISINPFFAIEVFAI